jgi:hypothetical protein
MPEIEIDDTQKMNEEPKKEAAQKSDGGSESYATIEDLQKRYDAEFQGIKKQLNGVSYYGRKMEEALKKIDSFQPAPQAPKQTGPVDELDTLVQTDWKAAVKKLAAEEAKALREQEKQEEIRQRMLEKTKNTFQENIGKVLSKYSDLNDPQSELSQKYVNIVQRHPEYVGNEYGPVLAMRDMEDELRSEGKLDNDSKKLVQQEVDRRSRSVATAVPKGNAATNTKSPVLTKEEKDMCDRMGVKYDTYLNSKKQMTAERQAEA